MTLLIVFGSIGAYLVGAFTTMYVLLATDVGETSHRCTSCLLQFDGPLNQYIPCPFCTHKQVIVPPKRIEGEPIFFFSALWPIGLPIAVVGYRAQLARDHRNKRKFELATEEKEIQKLLNEGRS